jgi:acid phosphatase type 7
MRQNLMTLTILLAACGQEPSQPSGALVASAAATAASAVLIAAGDIGCARNANGRVTANLVEGMSGIVATLGDNAYPDGTASDYRTCYAPGWGRFLARTRPSPGNHDYHTAGAKGYFDYFGSRAGPAGRGYYSYDLGSWHIVALNSERSLSEQAQWLKADLAAHPSRCTLAYWHQPLFTSGLVHPPAKKMRPLFTVLYQAGAEVVLSGHNHQYERFAPQAPAGGADRARGLRYFVVGSGGAGLYGFGAAKPNSELRYNGGYGVLKLTLSSSGYRWQFVSVAGKRFSDSGQGACH